MDPHMEDLFEKAQPFSDSELTFHPDCEHYSTAAGTLEDMIEECFGGEVARLMAEYTTAHFEVERFQCLHYFCQGYLAAKAEREQKKP